MLGEREIMLSHTSQEAEMLIARLVESWRCSVNENLQGESNREEVVKE